MKKTFLRLSALFMVLVTVLSFPVSAAAAAISYYDRTPVIVIPGFGQSETITYNADGSRLTDTSEFELPELDAKKIISLLAEPAIKSLINRKDEKLSKAAYDFLFDFFRAFRKNNDGTPVYKTVVREFNLPYSKLSDDDRAEIDNHITLDMMSDYDDIRYYFTYDTFGSVKEAADRLHNYVHMVLKQTGADKVSLIPVSQGGAVFIEYLDLYPEDRGLLKKVVGIVPAYDGSALLGDVLTDRVNIYDVNFLHETILPGLLGKKDSTYAISIALRSLFTQDMLVPVFRSALRAAIDCLVLNNTMTWALCPDEYYEDAKNRLLTDGKHDIIMAEADRFMLARENFKSNLDEIISNGTVVHSVVSYNRTLMMPFLFESGADTNADDLLQVSSPSLGATAAPFGSSLAENYTPVNPHCTDPAHNHISPDRIIDASTAYLPENTWFFKNISHTGLNGRNDVKGFAAELMLNDDIKDIYTFEGQTQFVKLPEYDKIVNEDLGRVYYYYNGEFVYSEKLPEEEDGGFSIMYLMFFISNIVFRFIEALK